MGNKLVEFDVNNTSTEDNFTQALSPFEEYLPGIRPSNSDKYLALLAEAMRDKGVEEERACELILDLNPFLLDKAHLKELVHRAYDEASKERGAFQPPRVQAEAVAFHEFMQRRYSLRRNEVMGITEYCERKRLHTHYRPVDETVVNSIALNAREEGINVWDRDVKRYLRSDRVMTFNPFDKFIYSLPKWDKHPRIDKLFHAIPTDDEAWYPLAHTWFLGMVALWMGKNRRKGNESMPILIGAQGVGKSTFCRSLLPPELQPYYLENYRLDDKRKALLMLTRYGLINFDEVNRLTERQQPLLKNMLQLPSIDEYKPYASTSAQMQRYASLIGTSNNFDVIADLTGSRRYVCVRVTGKIKQPKAINYPQIYAEAVHEIGEGRRYWLDEQDEQALMERNMRFVQLPAEAQTFDNLFDAAQPDEEGAEWLYASEIHHRLHPTINAPMTRKQLHEFSAFMNTQGVQTKRAKAGMVYLVKQKLPKKV